MRLCQVYVNSTWRDRAVIDLASGDIFRLFDDGKLVEDENGCTRWRAVGEPKVDAEGAPSIEMEPMPLTEVERQVETGGHWWPGSGESPRLGRLRG